MEGDFIVRPRAGKHGGVIAVPAFDDVISTIALQNIVPDAACQDVIEGRANEVAEELVQDVISSRAARHAAMEIDGHRSRSIHVTQRVDASSTKDVIITPAAFDGIVAV